MDIILTNNVTNILGLIINADWIIVSIEKENAKLSVSASPDWTYENYGIYIQIYYHNGGIPFKYQFKNHWTDDWTELEDFHAYNDLLRLVKNELDDERGEE